MGTKINGVKFTFYRNDNPNHSVMLEIRFSEEVQKHLNLKCGDQVLIDYDEKNPFSLTVTKKTDNNPRRGIRCHKGKIARNMRIRATWFSTEKIPDWATETTHAYYMLLENNEVKINLLSFEMQKTEEKYLEFQALKRRLL